MTHFPPASRSNNPRSSHEAERAVTGSGRRQTAADQIHAYVREWPGLTSLQLGDGRLPGIDRYTAARRLSDLEALGLVHKGEEVLIQRRPHGTWWPGPAPVLPPPEPEPPTPPVQGALL